MVTIIRFLDNNELRELEGVIDASIRDKLNAEGRKWKVEEVIRPD